MHLTRTKIDVDSQGRRDTEGEADQGVEVLAQQAELVGGPGAVLVKKKEEGKGEDKDPDWWKDRTTTAGALRALHRPEKVVATSEDVEEKKDVAPDALVDVGLLPVLWGRNSARVGINSDMGVHARPTSGHASTAHSFFWSLPFFAHFAQHLSCSTRRMEVELALVGTRRFGCS